MRATGIRILALGLLLSAAPISAQAPSSLWTTSEHVIVELEVASDSRVIEFTTVAMPRGSEGNSNPAACEERPTPAIGDYIWAIRLDGRDREGLHGHRLLIDAAQLAYTLNSSVELLVSTTQCFSRSGSVVQIPMVSGMRLK